MFCKCKLKIVYNIMCLTYLKKKKTVIHFYLTKKNCLQSKLTDSLFKVKLVIMKKKQLN